MIVIKWFVLCLLTKTLVQGFSVPLHSRFQFLDKNGELGLEEEQMLKSKIYIAEGVEGQIPKQRLPKLLDDVFT
ncbi:unnamed protein product [Schistocephalus solidus]|uniref:Secreted protein n=1 Tax=Schistocephalus solidus TaxID=70667 RepID=A0A183TFR1_SCHSO|nr:unnamed protein product [Schistocephalus solidus]